MKKNVILALVVLGIAVMLSGCGIKQTADTITVEAGQKLTLVATDFFDIEESKVTQITFDTSKLDVNTVGEYEVTAAYKKDTFIIKVIVEDTTAPAVEMAQRYAISNDIAAYPIESLIEGIYDASAYEVAFAGFEKTGDLMVLDDAAIAALMNTIPIPGDQEALAAIGTGEKGTIEAPTEEGIYRAVLAVTDTSDNVHLEEVYVIIDKTGALIADIEDKVVEQVDITAAPEVNPEDYSITDNVDGVILPEQIQCELELRDEEKHEYINHVTYTDRAGNESHAEFLITVTEKKDEAAGNGSDSESKKNSGTKKGSSGSVDNADNGSGSEPAEIESEPAPEESTGLLPTQQAVIDAGYYVVIPLSTGGYGVMVHESESAYGTDLIRQYLANIGLEPTGGSGGYINMAKDQYMCSVSADQIRPLITEDDPEFWD